MLPWASYPLPSVHPAAVPDAALPVLRPARPVAGPDAGGAAAAFPSARNPRTRVASGRDLQDVRASLAASGIPAATVGAAAAALLGAGLGSAYAAALAYRAHLRARAPAPITDVLDTSSGNVRAAQRSSRHRSLAVLERCGDTRAGLAGEMAALVAAGD